jgi:CheY-like chemotaxis protein/tRNA A-37 threonylcarbamoyl transferase component Bud32
MAKILLVDDDLELSRTLKGWLASDKHTVDNVHTGTEGWERASNQQYDLLILDWDLPDVNGIDILKRFRAMGGTTHVLMLTGRTEVENRAQGLDAGADDYLTKPFHVTELSARVRALLRRQESQKPFHKPLGTGNENVLAKADLAGSHLASRYEFIEVLGEGAWGIVFKARHPVMEKLFAIKMIRGDKPDEETLERFQIEAKAVSRLEHPSIVRIHDFGVTELNQPFMVMEYVHGKNLAEMLEKLGPPPLKAGLDICMQICSGLIHAHDQKILHRDIKPSNIVLKKMQDKPTEAKILDFGFAKLRGPKNQSPELTQRGDVLGSPPYMSPEQVRGDEVDERSDIYSLGCLAYELCTGLVPHMGKNIQQIMAKHIEEDASPMRKVRPELNIPEAVDQAILKALARKLTQRYQTMRDFKAALERASQSI